MRIAIFEGGFGELSMIYVTYVIVIVRGRFPDIRSPADPVPD